MRLRALSLCTLLALACTPSAPPLGTRSARRAQVRLDTVARALANAQARHDACAADAGRPQDCAGSSEQWQPVGVALIAAWRSLRAAQRAGNAFAGGDPRDYDRARPCLSLDLRRVEAQLVALSEPVPHGLAEVLPVEYDDSCMDDGPEPRRHSTGP